MIQFTTIEQLQDGDWHFVWPVSAPPYRIVLNGEEIANSFVEDYVFQDLGYNDSPPPLEIVTGSDLATSEIDRPFLRMQWYRDPGAGSYLLKEFVDGEWVDLFSITNVNSFVFTYDSGLLEDGVTYTFQLTAYNDTDDASPVIQYGVTATIPPTFLETDYVVAYDNDSETITLTASS